MGIKRKTRFCLFLIAMAGVLAACGDGAQNKAAPTKAPPTHTPFPTFAFVEPTKSAVFDPDDQASEPSTEAEDEPASVSIELDPKKVGRGLGRYEALDCAACHGEAGEGTDKADGLLDFAMSEDDFVTFMRSGGELGTAHQFSTDRLSNSGSRNLYQYLLSLAQGA